MSTIRPDPTPVQDSNQPLQPVSPKTLSHAMNPAASADKAAATLPDQVSPPQKKPVDSAALQGLKDKLDALKKNERPNFLARLFNLSSNVEYKAKQEGLKTEFLKHHEISQEGWLYTQRSRLDWVLDRIPAMEAGEKLEKMKTELNDRIQAFNSDSDTLKALKFNQADHAKLLPLYKQRDAALTQLEKAYSEYDSGTPDDRLKKMNSGKLEQLMKNYDTITQTHLNELRDAKERQLGR